MIKGMTESGFAYELEESVLDDYELLEDLCAIDKGENARIVAVTRKLLGDEQLSRLKEHLRDADTGRVPAKRMFEEFGEILSGVKAGKNS